MSSTNEDLALRVHAGSATALDELTRQNAGVLHRVAYRLYLAHGGDANPYGMELSDAAQIAFMGLYGAAMAYRAEKGYKLLSYLWLQTKKAFRDMYHAQGKDPLHSARSLDEPLPGDAEDFSLLDVQPDDSAAAALDDSEDALYWHQARAVIDRELCALTDRQGEAMRLRYLDGQTLTAIGEAQGCDYLRVKGDIDKALRQLRRSRSLLAYRREYVDGLAYRQTGPAAFRERCGSHVEILVERVEGFAAAAG